MLKNGNRKLTAFFITIAVYSAVILIAVFLLKNNPDVLPQLAVQLAASYGILCGLFYGSNVLEHFSYKGNGHEEVK